jgi:hypothetical protein
MTPVEKQYISTLESIDEIFPGLSPQFSHTINYWDRPLRHFSRNDETNLLSIWGVVWPCSHPSRACECITKKKSEEITQIHPECGK